MNNPFEIQISNDRLSAMISLKSDAPSNVTVDSKELKQILRDKGIVFGVKEDILQLISEDVHAPQYPIIVAEGMRPIKGTDGFLIDQVIVNQEDKDDKYHNKNLNLRNVVSIRSVKSGQLLAEIIQPTMGVPGKNILGKSIQAQNGKPLKLRPGKNVLYHMDVVLATIDGQVSVLPNTVNVFPVFEVNGDLDLKTGNIDFIGNVVIKGNVPTGYMIKAGGDIKVSGLVEGAHLSAGGSISISGGIAAGMRGFVEAGVNLYCNYLNQANCKVGKDVFVDSSILHSQVDSGGNIICEKGHIIGGEIKALGSVEANEIGNQHYMQTNIHIGAMHKYVEREIQLQKEMKEIESSIKKLNVLAKHINSRYARSGSLSQQDRLLLQKQQITIKPLEKQLISLEAEYLHIKEEQDASQEAFLKANKVIFPNAHIHFGRYSKSIQHQLQAVKISLNQGEIVSVPL